MLDGLCPDDLYLVGLIPTNRPHASNACTCVLAVKRTPTTQQATAGAALPAYVIDEPPRTRSGLGSPIPVSITTALPHYVLPPSRLFHRTKSSCWPIIPRLLLQQFTSSTDGRRPHSLLTLSMNIAIYTRHIVEDQSIRSTISLPDSLTSTPRTGR